MGQDAQTLLSSHDLEIIRYVVFPITTTLLALAVYNIKKIVSSIDRIGHKMEEHSIKLERIIVKIENHDEKFDTHDRRLENLEDKGPDVRRRK